jgi:hypothetical protein
LTSYHNLLIQNLQQHLKSDNCANVSTWLYNTFYDLGGKLTMGRDFSSLENGSTLHPGIKAIRRALKYGMLVIQFQRLPSFILDGGKAIFGLAANRFKMKDSVGSARELLKQRLQHGNDRPDIGKRDFQVPVVIALRTNASSHLHTSRISRC